MRRLLALAVLAAVALPTRAAEPEVVGGDWLVIGSVDDRARVPFNPDTLLRRYLLDRDAAPPAEGDSVQGTKDAAQTWKTVTADEEGQVGGGVTLAYRRVTSPEDRIVLADLARGSTLIVNGTPYAGDIYGSGTGPVPVALRAGRNDVFVRGVRGSFRLTFTAPPSPLVVSDRDATLPDVVDGRLRTGLAGVVLLNCTSDWMTVTEVASGGKGGFDRVARPAQWRIAPLGVLKVPVPLDVAPDVEPGAETSAVPVAITVRRDGQFAALAARQSFDLRHASSPDARVHTFTSAIDGSVQQLALRGDASAKPLQVVLSAHGAGVRSRGQARSYSARPGVLVVAATNRRRFGFDWQDWGRTDAYEALHHVLGWTGAPRDRVCLTGHSMGGHGTWHLAANDPDGFAAIAPSAGWSQFDHYGRGDRSQARREPWYGADAASDTLSLIENLAQVPTYVLHGTKDDNVPLSEARRMVEALRAAGAAPQVHFQEEAGHWWNGDAAPGADCVDWPPIFQLFAESRIPGEPTKIRWTTVDPVVDSTHHWVTVMQPMEVGKRIGIEGSQTSGDVTLTTENARLLRVRAIGGPHLRSVTLDGETFELRWRGSAWFRRDADGWSRSDGPVAGERSPALSGPFKRAFGNRFVLVAGTVGDDAEDRELLDRARYDSEVWRYRANGLAEVVTDAWFLEHSDTLFGGRNVILYGNADTNAAWDVVFEEDVPVRAERGALRVRRQTWLRGDAAGVLVHRRRGHPGALAAAFADTGPAGTRLHAALLTFVSGVGYPDYAAFAPDVLEKGDGGVLGAGWFDHRWR